MNTEAPLSADQKEDGATPLSPDVAEAGNQSGARAGGTGEDGATPLPPDVAEGTGQADADDTDEATTTSRSTGKRGK